MKYCFGVTTVGDEVTAGSWLKVNDAVEVLNVSRKTVYTYINNGKLFAKMQLGRRLVWIASDITSAKVLPGNRGNNIAQGDTQKLLETKLKMKVEFLEETLKVRQEQIDSLKNEISRLGVLLMLDKRSVFSRIKDYFIGSSSTPGVGIRL